MMSTDSAILLMLAEQRQTIAALEAENAALRRQVADLSEPESRPAPMPTWDQNGPTGETTT